VIVKYFVGKNKTDMLKVLVWRLTSDVDVVWSILFIYIYIYIYIFVHVLVAISNIVDLH